MNNSKRSAALNLSWLVLRHFLMFSFMFFISLYPMRRLKFIFSAYDRLLLTPALQSYNLTNRQSSDLAIIRRSAALLPAFWFANPAASSRHTNDPHLQALDFVRHTDKNPRA